MPVRWLSLALFGCMLLVPGGARAAGTPLVELGGGLGGATRRAREAVPPLTASASSIPVAEFSSEGLRTNGRVFGFDPREGPYSCSGTALSTPSRSIVLTAGHCVLEDGSTGRNLVFVPSYDHGRRPFGTFIVEVAYLMPQWRKTENPDFDVAALQVGPNPFGNLTDVVGGRGFVSGRSRDSEFQIFGYPAAALRGEELRSCRAHGLGSDELTNRFTGPPTLPASCDMAGGSSGGAWIVDGQYVDGVTSYGYTGSPNKLYSPYFGRRVGAFLAQLP
jgi:V8-like Glu-specific endopeptidase